MESTCPVCSNVYNRAPSEMKKCGLTCSRRCRAFLQRKSESRLCPTCGEAFEARRSQIKKGYGNYCSKQCWADTHNKRQSFRCVVCDSEFERAVWQMRKGYTRYCSRRCTDASKRCHGVSKNGRDNLFTNWQKREWLDDHCIECGGTDSLEIDHVVPRFAGGGSEKQNAQTLCKKCNLCKYHQGDRPYYWWLANRSIFNRTWINSI